MQRKTMVPLVAIIVMLVLALVTLVLFWQLRTVQPGTATQKYATTTAKPVATPTPAGVPETATTTARAAQAATAETLASQRATAEAFVSQKATATARALASQRATTTAQFAALDDTREERAVLHLSGQLGDASARYAPDVETLLLQNGYYANIIPVGDLRGLRASQLNYSNSVWTRDLDYAISGYSYALGDMNVLRENILLFLQRVEPGGIAPETIYLRGGRLDHENRQSWDSMPNLIHAVYVYVAKTGDRAFYRQHRDTLQSIGQWIVGLDIDGDALPDSSDYPYGYYDSVYNSAQHTYAIAKFYTACRELAELEHFAGFDSGPFWEEYAARMRAGFHRSFDEGGYWLEGQAWPIAWRQADGSTVNVLETFGVFSALQSGLIGPQDGTRYTELAETLHTLLPELMDDPTPFKLTWQGYEPEMRREVDPPVPLWMMDASAPWISGLAAPVYATLGYPEDAEKVIKAYMVMARSTSPPVLEFAAGPEARYGPGNSGDGGRTWDSAAWFMAIYGGHYGLTMTPEALVVQPRPFERVFEDGIENMTYQGAVIQMTLDFDSRTYHLQTDQPAAVRFLPMGDAARLRLNDSPPLREALRVIQPGETYTVVSESSE